MPNSICPSRTRKERLWIAVGDVHEDTANFSRIPELSEAMGVIVSGDLTNCGGVEKYRRVLEILGQGGKFPVLAQIGNMDLPEVDGWLSEKGMNMHGRCQELAPDVAILGIGGSTPTPMHTPSEFTEAAYAGWLEDAWQKASRYPHTVLVSHNPPRDTPCDRINDELHAGSLAVRDFIEQKQPDVCICGHIHEGRSIIKMGRTIVVNPGTLAEGGYVVLREREGRLVAELCEIAVHTA